MLCRLPLATGRTPILIGDFPETSSVSLCVMDTDISDENERPKSICNAELGETSFALVTTFERTKGDKVGRLVSKRVCSDRIAVLHPPQCLLVTARGVSAEKNKTGQSINDELGRDERLPCYDGSARSLKFR